MTDQPRRATTAPLYSRPLLRLSFFVFMAAASHAVLFLAGQPGIKTAHAATAPSIEISPSTYDFGEVKEGTKIEHDFIMKNTGTEVLNITHVKTG